MNAVIPGIYEDRAQPNPEKCTVLGGAINENGDDARVIIERILPCGSPTLQHLTLEAFKEILNIGNLTTPRFKLLQANYCQD